MLLVRANSTRRATAEDTPANALPGASPSRRAAPTISETVPTVEVLEPSVPESGVDKKEEVEMNNEKKKSSTGEKAHLKVSPIHSMWCTFPDISL